MDYESENAETDSKDIVFFTVKKDWVQFGDLFIRNSKISAFQKHNNYLKEFTIGIIADGKWHTVFRSTNETIRDENFELLEKFAMTLKKG